MGMTSARKLREIVSNTRIVIAVEMLCAAQAIDFRAPLAAGAGTAAAHRVIRSVVPHLDADRIIANDIAGVTMLDQRGAIVDAAEDVVDRLG